MNRIPVTGLEVFLAIANEGSLRAAGRALGIGAPAVSYQLKTLEKRLGVALMVRTTRSVELTEAGRILLRGVEPAFREILESFDNAREAGKSKTGTLRLTLPRSALKIVILPVLAEFQATYPEICLDLSINEGLVDIVREGFHAGIRLGDIVNPDMIAVRMTGPLTPAFAAAPSYLDAFGRPKHPRDLFDHKCVRAKYISANRIADWQYVEDGQVKTIDPPTTLILDSFQSVMQAVRDGFGIGWSMRRVIQDHLESGALETVLDQFVTTLPPFYLYHAAHNRRLEVLRLFVDFLTARRSS